MTEELVKGEDIRELFKSTGEHPFSFEYVGKVWEFRYRELEWTETFQAIEDAWDLKVTIDPETGEEETERSFNPARYYEDVFMMAIVKCPGDVLLTRTYLRQLDAPVIAKMVAMVPSPLLGEEIAKSKKGSAGTTDGDGLGD